MKSKLKEYRLLARLTQTEVAKAVGVSQPTYQRWESGASSVPKAKAAQQSQQMLSAMATQSQTATPTALAAPDLQPKPQLVASQV